MVITIAEIKVEGKDYVGYYNGKEVTRKRSELKAMQALTNYVKGQS